VSNPGSPADKARRVKIYKDGTSAETGTAKCIQIHTHIYSNIKVKHLVMHNTHHTCVCTEQRKTPQTMSNNKTISLCFCCRILFFPTPLSRNATVFAVVVVAFVVVVVFAIVVALAFVVAFPVAAFAVAVLRPVVVPESKFEYPALLVSPSQFAVGVMSHKRAISCTGHLDLHPPAEHSH